MSGYIDPRESPGRHRCGGGVCAAASRGRRSAYSLIELVIVISLTGTVLSGVGVAVHLQYRTNRQLRRDMIYSTIMPRLANQLRSDAHRANQLEVQGELIVLTEPAEASVEYRSTPQGIERTRHRRGAVLHREVFPLGDGVAATWRQLEVAGAPLLQLQVHRRPAAGSLLAARGPDVVEAAIGLDLVRGPVQPSP